MRNFGDAYRIAMNELPKFHMDAETVRDELHHRRVKNIRLHRKLVSMAAAACIFLVCGVGTAAAVNYHSSVIRVRNGGFSFTGGENMPMMMAEDVESALTDAGNVPHEAAAAQGEGEHAPEAAPQELEAIILEPVEYNSIQSFREREGITIAIPDPAWLGGGAEERVTVFQPGGRVLVSLSYDDRQFTMSQADNRGSQAYASSSVFAGDSQNERSFVNEQGMSYMVFDSVEDGEITATHAAISINGRDITLDFWGYGQEIVEDVLYRLDLGIYFTEQ